MLYSSNLNYNEKCPFRKVIEDLLFFEEMDWQQIEQRKQALLIAKEMIEQGQVTQNELRRVVLLHPDKFKSGTTEQLTRLAAKALL